MLSMMIVIKVDRQQQSTVRATKSIEGIEQVRKERYEIHQCEFELFNIDVN